MAEDDEFFNVNALIRTNVILSSLSLLGSLTIFLLYICRKNLRSLVFSLVFFLSISELINSMGNLMSINKLTPEENHLVCNIQAVIINYTDFCSLFWMCIISYTIRDLMINYSHDFTFKKKVFIFVGFILPLIFTAIQTINYFMKYPSHSISSDKIPECWCWIYDIDSNGIYVAISYSLYWILILINLWFNCGVINFLKKIDSEEKNRRKILKMVNKLYLYPLISIICYVFATAHRIYQLIYLKSKDRTPTMEDYRLEIILYLLHGIFNSFRGFLFFLVYGCDNKVKRELNSLFLNLYRLIFRRNPVWKLNSSSSLSEIHLNE